MNVNPLESRRLAWLDNAAYLSVYPGALNRLINQYKLRFNIADSPQQIFASIAPAKLPSLQPSASAPIPLPPHQNPTTAKQQRACAEADVKEIHRRAEAGVLNLRLTFSDQSVAFIRVPSFTQNDHYYNIELLKVCHEYAPPQSPLTDTLVDVYIHKFDSRVNPLTGDDCVDNGWSAYHATCASVKIVNGSPQPVSINPAAVALDNSKTIDWSKVYAGNIDQDERNRRAELWDTSINGNSLDRPPPHHLRSRQAYTHSNASRKQCPSKAEMQNHLTVKGYDTLVTEHCQLVLRMADGGDAHMEWMHNAHCILPSMMQFPETICTNAKHFNRRAAHVDEGNSKYQEIRADVGGDDEDACEERVARMYQIAAGKILNHVQSDDFVDREAYESFDHWYAIDSFTGALLFILLHEEGGGRQLHYPNPDEEFTESAMIQTLANRDLKRVKVRGLGFTNCESLRHMIRGRMPIPVAASKLAQWGSPEHPILGATFTILDECYRPTMGDGIVKFSYA